jgi:beta-galactosidase
LFKVKGSGDIIVTDNGNPADFMPFASHERKAFNGLDSAMIRSMAGKAGSIIVTAESPGLAKVQVVIESQ